MREGGGEGKCFSLHEVFILYFNIPPHPVEEILGGERRVVSTVLL